MSTTRPKLALVTGGTRRVGAAISAHLARAGWELALHYGHKANMDAELSAVLTGCQNPHALFAADLSDSDQVHALLPAIRAHFGRLPHLIVNNASLFEDDDPTTVTSERLMHHYAVNVVAPVLLAARLAEQWHESTSACVINILDQRIAQPHGDQLSYTLSKQALGAATDTLARALAPKVRVNAVAPGLTLPTPDYSAAQFERLGTMMPLARLPSPADIADAVAYLAGAEAVTGQTIFVDGGAAMRTFDRDFVHLARDF